MFFDERVFHIRVTSLLLRLYKFVKVLIRNVFHGILLSYHISDSQTDYRIQLFTALDLVFKPLVVIISDKILLECPSTESTVPYRTFCGQFGNQLVIFYSLQREFISRVVIFAELLHIHELSRSYLVMDVSFRCLSFLLRINSLKSMPFDIGPRNHKEVQGQ